MCCWCCRRRDKKEETTTIIEHAPYQRTSFKEHLANPTYMSHSPEKSPNYPVLVRTSLQHLISYGWNMLKNNLLRNLITHTTILKMFSLHQHRVSNINNILIYELHNLKSWTVLSDQIIRTFVFTFEKCLNRLVQ